MEKKSLVVKLKDPRVNCTVQLSGQLIALNICQTLNDVIMTDIMPA